MKDRIRQLMESQHMTQQIFANFLEMSPATLSSIFNDRTKPTLNVVEAIKKKIPTVNIDWLMFGIGDMFLLPTVSSEDNGMTSDENSDVKIDIPVGSEQAIDFGFLRGDSVANNRSEGTSNPLQNYPVSSSSYIHPSPSARQQRTAEPPRDETRYVERLQRKVTEIRVYYDDLTYETFYPSKK